MKPVNRRSSGRRKRDTIVAVALWLGFGGHVAGCGTNASSASVDARTMPGAGGLGGATTPRADGGGGVGGAPADGGGADRLLDGATDESDEASSPPPMATKIPVSPTFVTGRPTSDCSATLAAATKPIVLDATISCTSPRQIASLGAGLAGSGVVAASGTSDSRLLTISAAGAVTGDQGPAAGGIMSLAVQPTGAVDLVGGDPAGSGGGMAFFHATNGGWMRELLVPPLPPLFGVPQSFGIVGLGYSADGSVQLAYTVLVDLAFESPLATRSPSGEWTKLAARNGRIAALAVPPTGPAMIVHQAWPTATSSELDAWSNGVDRTIIALDGTNSLEDTISTTAAGTDASGALTASVRTPRRGVLVIRPPSASPRTVLIPSTDDGVTVGCPPLPSMATAAVAPMPCTLTGVGGAAHHALVVAADGTAWVAYFLVHIVRDVSQGCFANLTTGNGFSCSSEVMKDRSTLELVLEHVAADGSHTVRWRGPAGAGSDGVVLMDRRDALLHLAFSQILQYSAPPPTFQYLVVDTTGL